MPISLSLTPALLNAATTERCRLKHIWRWYNVVTLATPVAYLKGVDEV